MKNFAEFWPYYLGEHSHPANRRMHFVGTLLLHGVILYSIWTQQWLLLIAVPLLGYSFAWVGHFLIEKNRPATFKHPLWSLRADFKMFYGMLLGKIK